MRTLILSSFYLALATALLASTETTSWSVLKEGLASGNPEHRKQALVGIGAIGHTPEAVKLEVDALHTDKDPEVRQMAAAQLGLMKATEASRDLEVALDDPDAAVAFTAAKALWDMGNHRSKGELQDVLTGQRHDSEGFVSKNVRDAKKTMRSPSEMAKIGVKEASGALLGPFSIGVTAAEGMLKDGGAAGRAAAATMLAQDCDARAFQLLDWTLLNDSNWAVKAAVAKAIGQCGHKEEIPKLETFLSDKHPAMRFMAAGAIIRLSGTAEQPIVAQAQPPADTNTAPAAPQPPQPNQP